MGKSNHSGEKFSGHSKKALQKKEKAATQNAGGGKDGLKDRQGGAAGHSKFICKVCFAPSHDMTAMKIHYGAKHPEKEFLQSDFENLHEVHGGSTKGVAVRGSVKDKSRY